MLTRTMLIAAFAALLMQTAEPPEYPPGWVCTPAGRHNTLTGATDPSAKCQCMRVDYDPQCEGIPTEQSVCLQCCHQKDGKCGCPVHCDPQAHHH